MAAAFLSSVSPSKPNPSSYLIQSRNPLPPSCTLWSTRSRSEHRTDLRRTCFLKGNSGARIILSARRLQSFVPPAAHEESKHSDIEAEKVSELKIKEDASNEAWKQSLEIFKEEAMKMKEMSQEAYELYSKKAMETLKETSETLKIQADKTRHDLGIIAKEIGQEGQVYLSSAADKSPESVKDIVETFATFVSSFDDLKHVSVVRDFYLGIPYGALLATGGFLNFMLTGSIPAIRFGVILGSSLLTLSISSLRSWRNGQSSQLFLKGQAAIATIIFIREWLLLSKIRSFPTFLMTFISGGMVAFFVYRHIVDDEKTTESQTLSDEGSEK